VGRDAVNWLICCQLAESRPHSAREISAVFRPRLGKILGPIIKPKPHMSRARRLAQPEAAIQRAVFQHLRTRPAPGLFCFHVPNGGFRKPVEAAILKGMGVRAGVPDVICIHDGRTYALELKADGGRLTDSQQRVLIALRAAGARAIRRPDAAHLASLSIASRNLSNNLSDAGIMVDPTALMRSTVATPPAGEQEARREGDKEKTRNDQKKRPDARGVSEQAVP
jgi:VRR-NUC domain